MGFFRCSIFGPTFAPVWYRIRTPQVCQSQAGLNCLKIAASKLPLLNCRAKIQPGQLALGLISILFSHLQILMEN